MSFGHSERERASCDDPSRYPIQKRFGFNCFTESCVSVCACSKETDVVQPLAEIHVECCLEEAADDGTVYFGDNAWLVDPFDDVLPGNTEFSVEVVRGPEGLGLDMESIGATLCVTRVKDGPVMDWNVKSGEVKVRAGDIVVAVNGHQDDSFRMVQSLQRDTELNMRLKRPHRFCVSLNGQGVGQSFLTSSHRVHPNILSVAGIVPGGALHAWNEAHPEKKVEQGDQLISVNGVRDDPQKMVEMLTVHPHVVMWIVRPI